MKETKDIKSKEQTTFFESDDIFDDSWKYVICGKFKNQEEESEKDS
ncbi:MAG: hypothetical protein PUE08_04325 [Eubacteriales bacterium]|nr:hypothetical protein [Eubacteriales bacterium]